MNSPVDDRRALRKQLIEAREMLAPFEHQALSAQLVVRLASLLDELAPQVLGFCWPYRGEPDLRELLSLWRAQGPGRVLALPVVPEGEAALAFHAWRPGVAMAPDRFGIPAPCGTPAVQPDTLLVPCNGFDARGYRIGYGGGFFDRTLAAITPAPRTIGVSFELGRLEDVRPAAHDRPLDWIVTEDGAWPAGA